MVGRKVYQLDLGYARVDVEGAGDCQGRQTESSSRVLVIKVIKLLDCQNLTLLL